jgi:outer membrane immunogenic protein
MRSVRTGPARDVGHAFFCALSVIFALLAFPLVAYAADMAVKARPPSADPYPPDVWTGFYFGGQLGYGLGHSSGDPGTANLPCSGIVALCHYGPFSMDADGLLGGAHAGYNYQIRSLVVGIEGSYDFGRMSGYSTSLFNCTAAGLICAGPGNVDTFAYQTTAKDLWSVRGRLGYAVNNWLFYATAGVAGARVQTIYSLKIPPQPVTSLNGARTGWTVGAGIETMIMNDWSVGFEYRYTDLGAGRFTDVVNNTADVSNKFSINQITASLSYHFKPGNALH